MNNVYLLHLNLLEQSATTLLNGPAVVVSVCECAAPSPNITRASGSFVDDGVKPWSLLSGTIAARFPASTRVQSVSATTLVMTNNATGTTSGAESGTFTPTRALTEQTSYPTSNLMNGDRNTPWDPGAGPPATLYLEFDLGSNKTLKAVGALGVRDYQRGTPSVSTVDIDYGTTYASWSNWGTLSRSGVERDIGGIDTTGVTARFLRLTVTTAERFWIGGVWAGGLDANLGVMRAPGARTTVAYPNMSVEGMTGHRWVTRTGIFPRYEFELPWDAIATSARSLILNTLNNTSLGGYYRTPVLVDDDGSWYEVVFDNEAFTFANKFVNLDSIKLSLVSMP